MQYRIVRDFVNMNHAINSGSVDKHSRSHSSPLIAFDVEILFFRSATASSPVFACACHLVLLLPCRLLLGNFFFLVHFVGLFGVLFLDFPQLAFGRNALVDVSHGHDDDDVGNHKGKLGFRDLPIKVVQ